ncbi:hypothetical protein FHR72_002740 [Mycolicibacterium iranicum]|uniref:Secreted protein n=1 Tax=Mycolicibacterium iranicum TaxID=912594 RepID=A0A839QAM1_MYCIR|nr:hypothetical protein [Mycolicibacterium iranicum]MBB2991256.1 hypothetical protein [Mycolicibacterium iranicum]
MSKTTTGWMRARKAAAWAAVFAAPVTLVALSSATASAEELRPDRTVTSRQGTVSSDATFGEVRSADDYLHAQGEVRGSQRAVPDRLNGTRAQPFLPRWSGGPGIGGW